MCAATGNNRDCRKAIALGFCTLAKKKGYIQTHPVLLVRLAVPAHIT